MARGLRSETRDTRDSPREERKPARGSKRGAGAWRKGKGGRGAKGRIWWQELSEQARVAALCPAEPAAARGGEAHGTFTATSVAGGRAEAQRQPAMQEAGEAMQDTRPWHSRPTESRWARLEVAK